MEIMEKDKDYLIKYFLKEFLILTLLTIIVYIPTHTLLGDMFIFVVVIYFFATILVSIFSLKIVVYKVLGMVGSIFFSSVITYLLGYKVFFGLELYQMVIGLFSG